MQEPVAIIFDWDGTLVDTLDFVFKAHNHVREQLGEPLWSPGEFKEQTKFSSVQLYPIIYGNRAQEAMDILTKFMDENHLKTENLVILPGTEDFLIDAGKNNRPMGVLSNKKHVFLEREVDHMALRPHFRSVVGAGVVAADKASGVSLLHMLNGMGIKPGPDVWMVGDTITDILCARGGGCTAVLLHHDKDHRDLIALHKPEIIVRDMVALQQYVFMP